MNPLDSLPRVRAALYAVQWIANGVLTIAAIVFATNGTAIDALPRWYVLAIAIAPALWTYLGITAQADTPSYKDVVEGDVPPPAPEFDEHGHVDAGFAILLALFVIVLLLIFGVIW